MFATARRLEAMQDLESLPGVVLIQLDVTKEPSIRAAFSEVEARLNQENQNATSPQGAVQKGLDILVNNAGIITILPFADTATSVSQQIIETNLIAPMTMTKVFLPLLMRSTDACIVCVGSIAGLLPTGASGYNASKAGLRMWCDTVRMGM